MKEYLNQLIHHKKILILGFGREGESTYKTLRKYFPNFILTIADKNENIIQKSEVFKNDQYVQFKLGVDYLKSLDEFDIIIKTPGVSLKHIVTDITKEKITSQSNIFMGLYKKQIIGITGTKGKSTTSSLIFNIIHSYKKNSVLVGNIGIPPFDILDNIDENTIIVCELSSHQLEFGSNSPHIAILLNLFQEHLDHYMNYKEYQLSKFNICKFQNEKDFFIFHDDDEHIHSLIKEICVKSQILSYSLKSNIENGAYVNENKIIYNVNYWNSFIYEINKDIYLKGDHNLLNIMAAIVACKIKQIPDGYIQKGISEFKGLEHRMEYVGKFNEIDYYNDSIATIPEATIEAVKTLKNVNTLILGGYDRGIDYSDLAHFLIHTQIEHIIFIEKAGLRILSELKRLDNINSQEYIVVNTFQDAIMAARNKTKKNSICLLSPAAASYGMFKDFEERGLLFKKLVRNVEKKS
jgi:UDP-N-acetylmuramoyl-L-alanine---L-glutamate ligase